MSLNSQSTPDADITPVDRLPWWRWPILFVGWTCVLVLALNLGLKSVSSAQAVVGLIAAGTCLLGTTVYAVGRRVLFSKYSKPELRFVFAPMILGSIVLLGFLLILTITALMLK